MYVHVVLSVHRRRGVERRQVLPAGRPVAHPRQIPTCRTLWLQQAPLLGLGTAPLLLLSTPLTPDSTADSPRSCHTLSLSHSLTLSPTHTHTHTRSCLSAAERRLSLFFPISLSSCSLQLSYFSLGRDERRRRRRWRLVVMGGELLLVTLMPRSVCFCVRVCVECACHTRMYSVSVCVCVCLQGALQHKFIS